MEDNRPELKPFRFADGQPPTVNEKNDFRANTIPHRTNHRPKETAP
ncbi:hypothetical protein TVNIR_3198 [Thioalkalivibrio nitratireducens DSM 14787]|uniref:Uncharacterized protein n=1 Tax=Thioalkalivibrio nitratireducens (strain DSM 14787 / UNIQEM 213 / ALEN2) TaxID=1255043 RepID=L0E0T8_THIND|nr:hypothetical protein TVNIR_3198 [Thioalkalivibrio nitratireducens DSM 14787]